MYNVLWPKASYVKQCILINYYARDALKKIIYHFKNQHYTTTFDLICAVRIWVNNNSMHLIDQEHDSYAFRLDKVVNLTYQYNQNKLKSKPHLSCGPRAYLMHEILKHLSIKSHIIDIFEIVDQKPQSHTLIDCFDHDKNRWTLQDPDFNVYYCNRDNNHPLSAKDCLVKDNKDIAYYSNQERIENWTNMTSTIVTYFNLGILYRYSYEGKKSTFIYKNNAIAEGVVSNSLNGNFGEYLIARDYMPILLAID